MIIALLCCISFCLTTMWIIHDFICICIYMYMCIYIYIYIYIYISLHRLPSAFFSPFLWLHLAPCGSLVPRPGIEPGPLVVKGPSPNHWTAREFPSPPHFKHYKSEDRPRQQHSLITVQSTTHGRCPHSSAPQGFPRAQSRASITIQEADP